MSLTLKSRIYKYMSAKQGWVNGGEVEKKAMEAGYKSSNASRRLREMFNENILDRMYNERGHVLYRISEGTKGDKKEQKGTWIFEDNVAKYVQI